MTPGRAFLIGGVICLFPPAGLLWLAYELWTPTDHREVSETRTPGAGGAGIAKPRETTPPGLSLSTAKWTQIESYLSRPVA